MGPSRRTRAERMSFRTGRAQAPRQSEFGAHGGGHRPASDQAWLRRRALRNTHHARVPRSRTPPISPPRPQNAIDPAPRQPSPPNTQFSLAVHGGAPTSAHALPLSTDFAASGGILRDSAVASGFRHPPPNSKRSELPECRSADKCTDLGLRPHHDHALCCNAGKVFSRGRRRHVSPRAPPIPNRARQQRTRPAVMPILTSARTPRAAVGLSFPA